MPLSITLKSENQQSPKWEFPVEVDFISLGRNPDCDVKLDPNQTRVGRLHCVIRQRAGDYRLELNRHNVVFVNGEAARDGTLLFDGASVTLGTGGPELLVRISELSPELPPTDSGEAPPPGFETVSYENLQTTRRLSRYVTATIVAIAGIVAGLIVLNHYVTELDSEQQQIDLRLIELGGRTDDQKSIIASLETKFTGELEDIKNDEKEFIEALANKAESVCLVLIRDADGNFDPQATAWVVDQDKGLMATNAHVASLFNEISSSSQLLVRTPGRSPQDFVVEAVEIHPGYHDFDTLWSYYDPVKRTALGQMESVETAGTACDVALLKLRDPTGLPPSLPLADDAELAALKPGEKVAYIGYPIEGTLLFNTAAPSPTTQMGWLTAMTNYFGDDNTEEADRELLVHALPASGGTSGSPVLDRNGNVIAVHSGANVIGWAGNVRLVTSANIYFSQRCDLLRELLSGDSHSAQAQRNTRWQNTISRYFARRTDQEADVVDDIVHAWGKSLELDGDYIVTTEPIGELSRTMNAEHSSETVPLVAGKYHVGILAKSQTGEVSYTVNWIRDDGEAQAIGSGWLVRGRMESIPFEVQDAGTLEIVFSTTDSQFEASVRVDHGERTLRSLDDRILDRIALWQQQIGTNSEIHLEPVLDQEITVDSGSAVVDLDIDEACECLIMVISAEGFDADLTLNDGDIQIGQDRRYSSLGFVASRFEEPKLLKAYIVGPAEMTKVKFVIYKSPL